MWIKNFYKGLHIYVSIYIYLYKRLILIIKYRISLITMTICPIYFAQKWFK